MQREDAQEIGEVFTAWVEEASGGDTDLARILAASLARFRRRHSSLFIDEPGPGWRAMVRVFRGVAAVTAEGAVRSSELFRISDLDRFFADPAERAATIASTSWDDKAALFAKRQPPRRTREAPPLIDWAGAACARSVPDQVRQFEYFLNNDLLRDKRASLVLDTPRTMPVARMPGMPGRGIAPHRPLLPHLRESLIRLLAPLAEAEAAAALESFRARLDQDRLAAMAKAGANSVAAYNWLSGLEKRACNETLALRRTQAVVAYPFAWSLIAAPVGDVARAVAEARPLAPALAQAFGVPEKAMRRVNGIGIEEAGLDAAPDAEGAARVAHQAVRMPPGQPPKTSRGWRAYFAALSLADAIDRFFARQPDGQPLGAALLAQCGGRWETLDGENLAHAAAGLADMVQDFHANVAEPAARLAGVHGWHANQTMEKMAGGRSLTQLADASAWWHANQADIRARLGTLFPAPGTANGVPCWPALHEGGPWLATNGLVIVPLTDEEMLVAEHHRMNHCINRYAPNALYHGAHLLSVRRADGTPLGTVEIDQDRVLAIAKTLREPPDAPVMQLPPSVRQFKAKDNTVPRSEAWEALWEYVSAIMTGALEVDADRLRADLERRRATGRGRSKSAACYDTCSPEAVREAFACYAPMLSKSVAKRGPAAMVGAARPPAPAADQDRTPAEGPAPGYGF